MKFLLVMENNLACILTKNFNIDRGEISEMANAMEKWLNYEFSSGTVAGDDYKKFQRAAKADLKKKAETAGYTLHSFHAGHYDFSAVLRDAETGKLIYVAISDVRFFRNQWYTEVLYRTMKHDKDWSGGTNQFCTWPKIADVLKCIKLRGW